jgi:hypothetical protein
MVILLSYFFYGSILQGKRLLTHQDQNVHRLFRLKGQIYASLILFAIFLNFISHF